MEIGEYQSWYHPKLPIAKNLTYDRRVDDVERRVCEAEESMRAINTEPIYGKKVWAHRKGATRARSSEALRHEREREILSASRRWTAKPSERGACGTLLSGLTEQSKPFKNKPDSSDSMNTSSCGLSGSRQRPRSCL